jgi:hypothetical protein
MPPQGAKGRRLRSTWLDLKNDVKVSDGCNWPLKGL